MAAIHRPSPDGAVEDYIRAGGLLMLGTRLKRLGDRLQADVQQVLSREGVDVAAGLMPLLAVVHRHGPLAVTDVARAVRIAQPGATRALDRLRQLGLVCDVHHQDDQRVRLVALTPAGDELVARLRSGAWLRIEQAVSALCRDLDGPLLTQLAAVEDALEDRGLDVRVEELGPR
jgi:DNA-binding MarR family transcriptional regulator